MYKTTVSCNRSESDGITGGTGVYVINMGINEFKDCSIIGNYSNSVNVGLCVDDCKLTVENTDISKNIMGNSGAYGGGVLVEDGGELEMRNSQVHNNQSAGGGAGIMVYGKLYAEDCQIYGNKAGQEGGGICGSSESSIYLAGNTVVGDADATHAPTQAEANAAGFKGNVSGNFGGAGIYFKGGLYLGHKPGNQNDFSSDANATVKIVGNYSSDRNGGGICDNNMDNSSIEENHKLYMYNTTVSHNAAASDGNGIYISKSSITIDGATTMTDNDVYLSANKVIFVDEDIVVPTDETVAIAEISLPSSVESGNILEKNEHTSVNLTNVAKHIAVNKVGYGLEVPSTATNMAQLTKFVDVIYCNRSGNITTADGTISEPYPTIALAVEKLNRLNNPMVSYEIKVLAQLVGDQVIGGNIKARKIIISGNSTGDACSIYGQNTQDSKGSVLTVKNTKTEVEIQNLKIYGGYAAGETYYEFMGGGIYIDDSCKVTLGSGVVVTGNTAGFDYNDGHGGGAYVGKGAMLVMNGDAQIANNQANRFGGGVYVDEGATFVMNDAAKITSNILTSESDQDPYGGFAVYVKDATFVMNGGEISGHQHAKQHQNRYRGAVRLEGKCIFNMSGGKITDNKDQSRGANIYAYGEGLIMNISGGEISSGNIEDSNYDLEGAGICLEGKGAILNMSGGMIMNNTIKQKSSFAYALGAGVYIGRETKFVMTGGTIANNEVLQGGCGTLGMGVCCAPKDLHSLDDKSSPATVKIGGDAYIPLGDDGKNDFYLCGDGVIDIISNLTKENVVTITPENYTHGKQLLKGLVADNVDKINLPASAVGCGIWSINNEGNLIATMPETIDLGCAPAIIRGAIGEITIVISEAEVTTKDLSELKDALDVYNDALVTLDLSNLTVSEPSDNSYNVDVSMEYILSAFHGNGPLQKITLPKFKCKDGSSYTKIGAGLLAGHQNLKTVIIPSTITQISENAFYNCSGLTTITIPETVTQIGKEAFNNCSSLTTVNFGGTNEQKDALLENIADEGNGYLKNADWICVDD